MKMKKIVLSSLLLVVALSMAACSKSDTESTPYNFVDEDAMVSVPNYAADYTKASYEERAEILGVLEKYATENWLTGYTLYGDGTYMMYNDRITKGTNTYITGYGFGILTEGEITAPLSSSKQPVTAWQEYYHSYQTEDPKNLNYMNDDGSVVGNFNPYIAGSYWTTFMNSTKDGYEWVNDLANEKPVAVDDYNDDGYATTYRFEVKVGSDLKYSTGTSNSVLSKYNNSEVQLEDYLTPFKILHNSQNGYSRGTGEGLAAGSSEVVGVNDYIEATKNASSNAETLFDGVGIKAYEEGGKSYLEFEFVNECNDFYAMYYLSSGMYQPIPQDFLNDLAELDGTATSGATVLGVFTNSGLTPVDTWLSTGPYYVESWESDKAIVFGKNEHYTYSDTKYDIKGIHYSVFPAVKTDTEAAFNEFIAGGFDAVSIPTTKLDQYKSDPRTTMTTDSSTFKLNINSTTQSEWEALFGKNGTVCQTPEADYWEVEPAMSNDNFLLGLYYAINRDEYATKRGNTASANFFGSAYMADPINGISYNSTDAHNNAVSAIQDGTSNGYNFAYAQLAFKKAAEELLATGAYKVGDTINIEIAWMYASNETDMHNDLKQYFESAFNGANTGLTLNVNFWVGAEWYDVYYDKMMVGQFDLGFGSISGNTLNPLNFFEVLKSDNSSGFTLNWGTDTSKVDENLIYDGKTWSFDDLWQAADTGLDLLDDKVDSTLRKSVQNADGSRSVAVYVDNNVTDDLKSIDLKSVILEYTEDGVTKTIEVEGSFDGFVYSFDIPKEIEDLAGKFTVTFTYTVTETVESETDGEDPSVSTKEIYTNIVVRPQ